MSSIMTSMLGVPGRPELHVRCFSGSHWPIDDDALGQAVAEIDRRKLTARHVEGDPPHAHRMDGDRADGETSGRAHRHAPRRRSTA